MTTIKEYTNDTDFVIVITAKDNQYYVSQIDTCGTIKPKCLKKFDNLDQAEQFAEKENKQYFFE